jgi:CDP-diacylglycerol--glycerol-3-phosphate 3-phosphatidyltransferase
MVSIYELKPKFQQLLRPLVRALANAGVTANQVTIAAMVLSIGTGVIVYLLAEKQWVWLIVPMVLFVRMALNAIDGMLAREHGMKSALGAYLNELGDMISDTALYLAFLAYTGVSQPLLLLLIFLAIISEIAGIMGQVIGASRRYDGPMGKSDRAFVFGVVAIIFACGVAAGLWTSILFAIISGLIMLNCYWRISRALKEGSV